MSAMTEGRAGEFAGRRRGGMSQTEVATAQELRAKGRSVQFIASYLGRSMQDVSVLFMPQVCVVVPPEKQQPRPKERAGAMSKDEAFRRLWNAGVPIEVIVDGLSISRSSVRNMRIRLGLPMRVPSEEQAA